jgi:hypothetical protein
MNRNLPQFTAGTPPFRTPPRASAELTVATIAKPYVLRQVFSCSVFQPRCSHIDNARSCVGYPAGVLAASDDI